MKKITKNLSFLAVAVLILMMMAATVIEKLRGTEEAFRLIYHNPVFIIVWALTAIFGLIFFFSAGVPKKVFTLGIHLSFVVILAGALTTHLFGESGSIHLREGAESAAFESEDSTPVPLPFSMRLDAFDIAYHPGSKMPSDYRSAITFIPEGKAVEISMNNIAKYRGYRFYQADYDEDGKGSILAVSHDPWGVRITYAGYLLLLISMIGFFFQKNSAFRAALKRVAAFTAAISFLLLVPAASSRAESKAVKKALGRMYVYYGHRVCPFDTYLKETGLDTALENLDKVPLFPVADSAGTVSWYAGEGQLPDAVFEKENLWTFIRKSPSLVRESLSEGKEEEAILCLTLGILLFILGGILITKRKKYPAWILYAGALVAILIWLYLCLVIGLRWYVSGTGPYVGRYNVMMLMAWFSTLAILLLFRRFPLIEPLGFLLAGFTMLLASREGVSPHITPLMPVLRSPLLSIHVLSMMMSYTLFGLVMLNGIMGVAVPSEETKERLRDVSLVVLYPAVFLLTFGTFLGAVWANISWGSYWAWDPKETWALVTLLVYAFTLHGGSLKAFRKPNFFHWYTIFAFLCVLITYFGVNLILGGMHSYA